MAALVALPALPHAQSASAATTHTFGPSADAHVSDDNPTSNYGTRSSLKADGSPVDEILIRFPVSGLSSAVTTAKLRLYVDNGSADGPAVYRPTAGAGWDERSVTWTTRPAKTGAPIADVERASSGEWIEYDVTAAVTGNGVHDFILASSERDGTGFASKEASSNRPQLVVETGDAAPPPGSPPLTTFTLAPEADAAVEEEDGNSGTASSLGADLSPMGVSYLRFMVPDMGGPASSATLRLFATGSSKDGPVVHRVGNDWSESGVTWSDRPAEVMSGVGDAEAISRGGWVDYDVTAAVTGSGPVSFMLDPQSTDGADFSSREAGSNRPQLVVKTPDPSAPTPSSSTTTSSPTTTTTTSPPPATFAVAPDADAWVDEEDGNAGTASSLGADLSPMGVSYLRFMVPDMGGPASSATLRLFATGSSKDGPVVHRVGNDWSETGLRWSSRPPVLLSGVADVGPISRGGWVDYDVTAAVAGSGPASFVLDPQSTDGADFSSREAGSNRPQLVVAVPDGSAPTPTSSTTTTTTTLPPTTPPSGQPNFVVFLTDDQRVRDTMGVMPKTMKWFAEEGTTFTQGFATTPLCCPSRSGIFSGRYTHNHGNLNNQTTDNLDQDATFQKYLRDAGYQTGVIGKFLIGWSNSARPPNFDYWALSSGKYHDASFGTDQGSLRADYTTHEVRRQALRMLDAFERQDSKPWVLYVSTQAPHEPWEPEEAYEDADVGTWDGNAATDETDRSDKPSWVRSMDKSLSEGQEIRVNQLRTLKSVDDMVDTVMNRIGALGEGGNTVAMFTSDNAYQWGEHGLFSKYFPYNESIHVPFMVRWPGKVPAGRVDHRYVGNVDIAPSMLAAAGAAPALKYPLDGRPFLSTSGLAEVVRPEAYLEYFEDEHRSIPDWASIRTTAFQYIEYYDSDRVIYREYYDLVADPEQLTNMLATATAIPGVDLAALSARVQSYRRCAGTGPGGVPCA